MKIIFNEFDDDAGPLHAVQGQNDGTEPKIKWKIILLEDAGELFGVDAKEKMGQGLAQLLNLTDGMLGQGLKLVFIVTTNETIEKLHPAVSRPGRCAVRQVFQALSKEEANNWLKAHKVEDEVTEASTIAKLYAKIDGSELLSGFNPPTERRAGFV
jgi:hypothetical protein